MQICHEHGVMHRDLKPENFLFADESEASPLKAIDFGLSIFFTPGMHFFIFSNFLLSYRLRFESEKYPGKKERKILRLCLKPVKY